MPRRRYALIVSATLAVVAASGAAYASDTATAAQFRVSASGAASEAGTSVPEPGSITLISAGLTLLLAATRRFMG
jgi:hypothetical protein